MIDTLPGGVNAVQKEAPSGITLTVQTMNTNYDE
jgi:hypothetical protein